MIQNVYKLNALAILLYCFVQDTNNSHLRLLQKLADKLSVNNRALLPSILTKLLQFEENMSTEVYNFYLEHAGRNLHNCSSITRTKCISILSYLCQIRLEPILPLVDLLRKQQKEDYWELRGQLLIFSANALVQFNMGRIDVDMEGSEGSVSQKSNERDEPIEEKEEMATPSKSNRTFNEGKASAVDATSMASSPGKAILGTTIVGTTTRNNGLISAPGDRMPAPKSIWAFGEIQITEKVIKEYEPIFFEIINTVFSPYAAKATVKVGLIYLAKIIDLYPEFTASYLNILLSSSENVRTSTL